MTTEEHLFLADDGPVPTTVEPGAYYEVTLRQPVTYGGRQHWPGHRVIIAGAAWGAFKDAIMAAKKLPPGAEGRL